MFCANCGSQIGDRDMFCPGCGKAVNVSSAPRATTFAQNQTVVNCTTYSAQPISYESRLVPILRHPMFFISSIVFLAISIYDSISWLPVLSIFLEQLEFYIFDFLRVIALLGSNILFIVGLLLLVIGGLTKNRSPIGAALSLNVIALCLQLLALALRLISLLEDGYYLLDGYYSYSMMVYFVTNMVFSVPVTLLMLIFALRANGIARAMNNGQNCPLGSGPAIMLLVYVVISVIVELFCNNVSGYSWTYYLENYGIYMLPTICFGIFLFLKRKNK